MEQRELRLKEFAVELFKINAIKFGEYKTKVGLMTPVYCDLRVLVSYPKIMVGFQSIYCLMKRPSLLIGNMYTNVGVLKLGYPF